MEGIDRSSDRGRPASSLRRFDDPATMCALAPGPFNVTGCGTTTPSNRSSTLPSLGKARRPWSARRTPCSPAIGVPTATPQRRPHPGSRYVGGAVDSPSGDPASQPISARRRPEAGADESTCQPSSAERGLPRSCRRLSRLTTSPAIVAFGRGLVGFARFGKDGRQCEVGDIGVDGDVELSAGGWGARRGRRAPRERAVAGPETTGDDAF